MSDTDDVCTRCYRPYLSPGRCLVCGERIPSDSELPTCSEGCTVALLELVGRHPYVDTLGWPALGVRVWAEARQQEA